MRPDGFEKDEIEFIKNNYKDMKYSEINNYLNQKYNKNRTEKQIRRKARYLNLSKINTSINKDFFNKIDNIKNAYWLGFIYADGYIYKSNNSSELGIMLSYIDINHLEKFNNDINGNLKISKRTRVNTILDNKNQTISTSCEIRIFSNKIVNDLISHNVTENKTYKNIYPIIDDDILFFNFLRGYFDGDGCIWFEKRNKNNVNCKITSINYDILYYIHLRLLKYNINSKIYYSNNSYNGIYNLHIRGRLDDKVKFLNLLYENANVFLDRKYKLYKDAVQLRDKLNN